MVVPSGFKHTLITQEAHLPAKHLALSHQAVGTYVMAEMRFELMNSHFMKVVPYHLATLLDIMHRTGIEPIFLGYRPRVLNHYTNGASSEGGI